MAKSARGAKTTGKTKSDIATAPRKSGETHQIASGDEDVLTTNQGTAISDNQNSLKAGARGPTLLEDFVLREKITHFDHERIPERIVHARGSGAHGFFQPTKSMRHLTKASFLQDPKQKNRSLRPLLDRRRRRRLGRSAARRARLRGEVLYR